MNSNFQPPNQSPVPSPSTSVQDILLALLQSQSVAPLQSQPPNPVIQSQPNYPISGMNNFQQPPVQQSKSVPTNKPAPQPKSKPSNPTRTNSPPHRNSGHRSPPHNNNHRSSSPPRRGSSLGCEFTKSALSQHNQAIINTLYLDQACTTCGFRFKDPLKKQKHLDWHFMMNRRERNKLKKPLSRSWFLTVEDWNTHEELEAISKPGGIFSFLLPFYFNYCVLLSFQYF